MFKIGRLFCLLILLVFVSCKKEVIQPKPSNDNTVKVNTNRVDGVNWVLSRGRVYIENLDNGDKTVYDYFDNVTTVANTHILGLTSNPIDSIKRGFTSWFIQPNTFTLNGGKQYGCTLYNGVYNVIGLEDGSARPIIPTHVSEDAMTVIFHTAYGSLNGVNYKYWSELTFIKSGTKCDNCQPSVPYGWVYGGVWKQPTTTSSTLMGTKWVIQRYNNGLSGNVYPNDTLDFISNTFYTINGGTKRTYTLYGVSGNNMKSLSLYSCTTLGGDYSGQVINTFIDDRVINNSEFIDINMNNKVTVWMVRIE